VLWRTDFIYYKECNGISLAGKEAAQMKKLCVLLYSIALLGVSFYGLSNHSYYVQILINLGRPYMDVRIALVIVLMLYAFIPWLRIYVTKTLLGISGMTLLSLGVFTIFSPSLLGHLDTWMRFGDNLTLIEGGILAVVLSTELSARRTTFMARSYAYVQSLFATQPRKLVYSVVSQETNVIKQVLDGVADSPVLKPLVRAYALPREGVP
jgi:hypothetical protein